jgi:hypothetical protein
VAADKRLVLAIEQDAKVDILHATPEAAITPPPQWIEG